MTATNRKKEDLMWTSQLSLTLLPWLRLQAIIAWVTDVSAGVARRTASFRQALREASEDEII